MSLTIKTKIVIYVVNNQNFILKTFNHFIMTSSKNLFVLVTLCLFSLFNQNPLFAQPVVFDDFSSSDYNNSSTEVKATHPTPSFDNSYALEDLKEGTNVIDTDPATGAKLLVRVRGNQLADMAVQYVDGTIKSFEESRDKECSDAGVCHKFQSTACYSTLWGCVCVCSTFSTPSGENNGSTKGLYLPMILKKQ